MSVTIYTKDYCPYCVKVKSLLTSIGASFEEIDVTHNADLFMEIYQKSHMRTVPQIFSGDECLGGFSDIEALHQEGKLLEKL